MSTQVEVITKESEREEINTEVKGKRSRKRAKRRGTREKRNNGKGRKKITKGKGTNEISINIMVDSMKRIRKEDFGRRERKIEKVV